MRCRHCGLLRHGCGRRRRFSNWRNRNGGRLNCNLLFARSRSYGRLYNHASRWRSHNNNGARRSNTRRSLGHDCACGRTRCNGRSGRRKRNDGRCRARLRNNLARFWPGWRCLSGPRGNGSHGGGRSRFGWRNDRWLRRKPSVARLFFRCLFLGQESLHHIAGLGDVRQIDLGNDSFRAVASRRRAGMRGMPRFPRKVRTNLLRLVQFQRAGVRLAAGNAQFR